MVRIAHAHSEHPLPLTHSEAFPGRKSVLTFPTLIHAGSGINIVPNFCEAYGDVRLLPGLSADVVKRTIQEHLITLSIEDYRLDDLMVVPAAETSAQAEIVRTLAAAIERSRELIHVWKGAACVRWVDVSCPRHSNGMRLWGDLWRCAWR
jgi:acetylornithine deacetylase/succinyl-diaminopimelate desuccinylase-like protein